MLAGTVTSLVRQSGALNAGIVLPLSLSSECKKASISTAGTLSQAGTQSGTLASSRVWYLRAMPAARQLTRLARDRILSESTQNHFCSIVSYFGLFILSKFGVDPA